MNRGSFAKTVRANLEPPRQSKTSQQKQLFVVSDLVSAVVRERVLESSWTQTFNIYRETPETYMQGSIIQRNLCTFVRV